MKTVVLNFACISLLAMELLSCGGQTDKTTKWFRDEKRAVKIPKTVKIQIQMVNGTLTMKPNNIKAFPGDKLEWSSRLPGFGPVFPGKGASLCDRGRSTLNRNPVSCVIGDSAMPGQYTVIVSSCGTCEILPIAYGQIVIDTISREL